MLQSSFIHIPGIGETTERALWEQGVHTWDHLEEAANEIFGAKRAQNCLARIEESRIALDSGELSFFKDAFGSAHAWRLLPLCEDGVAYLDIESTGMGMPPLAHSTSVAVVFNGDLFVEWEARKKRLLFEKLEAEAQIWVTFNGLCFDLPFLRREFGLALDQPHLDLRVWLRRLGFTGGLKKIQAQFTEVPQRSSMDIDGYDAVKLWRMHQRGVPGALETLMTYNAEDTVVLEHLVHRAWDMQGQELSECLPGVCQSRPAPNPPQIQTEIHSHVFDLLRGNAVWELPSEW